MPHVNVTCLVRLTLIKDIKEVYEKFFTNHHEIGHIMNWATDMYLPNNYKFLPFMYIEKMKAVQRNYTLEYENIMSTISINYIPKYIIENIQVCNKKSCGMFKYRELATSPENFEFIIDNISNEIKVKIKAPGSSVAYVTIPCSINKDIDVNMCRACVSIIGDINCKYPRKLLIPQRTPCE